MAESTAADNTQTDNTKEEYLGDGVYAIFDGYGIWLHANDHLKPTDRVYLEPGVFRALERFAEQVFS